MINNTIEIVAGYQTQDADGYATSWDRTSVGANWFINKHDTKVQLTYRNGADLISRLKPLKRPLVKID